MNCESFVKGTPSKNFFRQRGQVMLLFALFVPLLFLFAGMGIDLGWYYLNVSRLQNAADAAVLAGAKELLKELKVNNSKYASYQVALVYQHPDESNLYTVSSLTKSTTADATDITAAIKSTADKAAVQYARKNLSSGNVSSISPSFFSVAEAADTDEAYSLEDSWARKNQYNEIKMDSPQIYKDGDDFYYVVQLQEDIQHLFMPGWFEPMDAPVVAVAKISKTTSSSGGTPKVVFDANGGQINKSDGGSTSMAELGELDEKFPVTIKLPSGYEQIPTREGYNFKGWSLKADGSGKNVYGTDIYTEGDLEAFFKAYDSNSNNAGYDYKKDGIVTLYAVWVKVQEPKQPKVIFDANGGRYSDGTDEASKNFKAASEMEDDEVSEPLTPSKGVPTNGSKEFKGWTTEDNKNAGAGDIINIYLDGDQLSKEQMEELFGDSDEVTLYAVWEDVRPNNNRTLWEQMQYLIAKNVYDPDWDVSVQKYGKEGQTAKIVHNSFDTIDKTYVNSDHYYTEYINLETSVTNSSNVGNETRYFIDFRRNDYIWEYLTYPKYYYGYNVSNFRVHSLFNVNKAYDVRSEHVGKDDDPLYIRIEAEPGNDYHHPDTYYGTYAKNFTPVRQIVININANNTDNSKRPLFFFYDGPDAYKSNNAAPQPVILNLNANFKGVLWMPDVPVVINGNGYTFEGFIVAKEYRYLSTSGSKVKYSLDGKTIKNTTNNKIYVDKSNGNVNSVVATGANALATYNSYATKATNGFNLSSNSKFRTFKADTGVNFTYVFYDDNLTMDESPFHEYSDINNDLVPLYRFNASGEQVRVTNWDDVKLYDKAPEYSKDSNGNFIVDANGNLIITNDATEIPKTITGNKNIRTVRLDSNDNPEPVYDEAGNPVYFCESYVKVTGSYDVFTINRVDDQTRDPKEFLLTKTDNLNVPDTDDWK